MPDQDAVVLGKSPTLDPHGTYCSPVNGELDNTTATDIEYQGLNYPDGSFNGHSPYRPSAGAQTGQPLTAALGCYNLISFSVDSFHI